MRSRAIHRWNSKTAFTLASFFCLFLFGLFDSLKGSTLSTLLKDLNLNYSLGGTIILGQYSGYFLSTFITGIFIDQLGHRATLILAAASMIIGTAGYASVSTLPFLFLFILFIGFGLGTLELCGSNIITTYYPEKKGRYLNMLSAMSGIAAILSPFLAGRLLHAGHSWRFVYYTGLILLIPIALYFISLRAPGRQNNDEGNSHSGPPVSDYPKGSIQFFRKDFVLMYLINFMYMAAEMGLTTWLVEFYITEHNYASIKSAQLLSFFYITMTFGRFAGSLFIDRIGRFTSTVFASLGVSICIFAGLISPGPLSMILACSGLFYSIVFPTVTAMLSSLPCGNAGRVQGLYFAFGGLGGMFGPWFMGIINTYFGLKFGILLPGLLFLFIFMFLLLLKSQIIPRKNQ